MYTNKVTTCPECQRAFSVYLTAEQLRTRSRWLRLYGHMFAITVISAVVYGCLVLIFQPGRPTILPYWIGAVLGAVGILSSLMLMKGIERKYAVQAGQLLIETDGTPHLHLDLVNLHPMISSEHDNRLGIIVYRTFLEVEPLSLVFDLKSEAQAEIWKATNGQWELVSNNWNVVVKDPFDQIVFDIEGGYKNYERLTWWNNTPLPSLMTFLEFVTTWTSVQVFMAHVLRAGNTVAAPLARQSEQNAGLLRLHNWVVSSAPAPLPGRELREAIKLLIRDEPNFNTAEEQVGTQMDEQLQTLLPYPISSEAT